MTISVGNKISFIFKDRKCKCRIRKLTRYNFSIKYLQELVANGPLKGLEWSHMKEVKAPPQTNLWSFSHRISNTRISHQRKKFMIRGHENSCKRVKSGQKPAKEKKVHFHRPRWTGTHVGAFTFLSEAS